MAIFSICCLSYNKNKFLQKNPAWAKFDNNLKNKDKNVEIELQDVQYM